MNDNGDSSGASKGKPWERSWSTDEMRQNAHAWNLAGDAGLLKHLQEFSQAVLARTHTTEKSLDLLNEEINTLTSDLNTTNNKFLCLANTQFVENRVYDDDDKETPQAEAAPEKKSKEETEAKMLQKVREALSMSVAVLDTMFEPVEIQASDSEGECDTDKPGRTKTLILEPHNPYIHRPLPHLIGSVPFMSDDQIGLGDTPSDDEDESAKVGIDHDMETSSESDVDFTPFANSKRDRDMYSSHSSMSDHPGYQEKPEKHPKKIKPTDPVKNFDEDNKEVPEPTSSTGQSAQTNSAFAAQLAAKLDKIASPLKTVDQSSQNISVKSTSGTEVDLFGGVHSDDEDDGLFSGNSNLFSGRPKLFDDLKDTSDSLWGPEEPKPTKTVAPENKKTEQDIPSHTQNRMTSDLFSSNITDDEDDLFSIKSTNIPKGLDAKSQIKNPGSISSTIAKQHHLKVGEIRPGLATSTPERGHEEETTENSSKLFGSVSQNLTQDLSTVDTAAAKSSLAENEPSSRIDHPPQEKKPAGGVPMFGQANILAGLKAKLPRRQSSSSSESSNSDPSEKNSGSLKKSESTFPSVNHPAGDNVSADQGWSSTAGASQHSQSASLGFASPALTSTRLSNDDGYQTRNVLNSVSSIPPANNDSDGDNIFPKKPSVFDSQNQPSLSGGLFAEVNDEDDDLFAVSPATKKVEKEQSQLVFPHTAQRDSLNEEKKAPISVPNETMKTAQPSTNNFTKANTERSFLQSDFHSTVPPPLKSESKVKKPVSLFDDSDSGEDEFLFSSASSAGSRRSQASTDILASAAVSSSEKKPLSKKGLFDDDDTLFGSARNDPDIDIFSDPSKPIVKTNTIIEKNKPIGNKNFVEEDVPASSNTTHNSTASSVEKAEASEPVKVPTQSGIFQDDLFAEVEDNDDLFSIKSNSAVKTDKIVLNPPSIEDEEDDLFQNVSVPKSKQEEVTQSSSSMERTVDSSAPISKPSLIVENSTDSEKHATNVILSEDTTKTSTVKNYSIIEKPNFSAQPSRKPEPPRTLNIRKETDPGLGLLDDSDDDDLFGTSAPKMSIKTAPKTTPAPKPPQKPQIASKPDSISVAKSVVEKNDDPSSCASVDQPPAAAAGCSEIDGAAVSVSKLKDSLLAGSSGQPALKIDPRAFLPGQKPPPRKTPPKEVTDGFPVTSVKEPLKTSDSENAVGFEQPATNNTTLLPSANKDRAKLGVKRRPPSNKARRDAARASMNLDQSDRESPLSPDAGSVVTDSTSAVNNSVASSNSVLSPSTDEDDLFGVPQDLPPEYGNQTLSSSDIFSEAPILSPLSGIEPAEQSYKNEKANSQKISEEENSQFLETKTILFSPPDLEDTSQTDELFVSTQPRVDEVSLPNTLPVTENCITEANSTKVHPVAPNSSKTSLVANQVLQDTVEESSDSALFSSESSQNRNVNAYSEEDISTKPPSAEEITGTTSAIDPLNKADQLLVSNDDELFKSENDFDDHSSIFPFVKKKPESKQSSNKQLFSQTPTLPSKEDVSVTKPGLGGLDDVDDDDLFSSSSKSAIGKKKLDTSSKLKGKEAKTWKFSDEDDDDDLFQSSFKTSSAISSSNSSTKAAIPVSSSIAVSGEPKSSTITSLKPEVSAKKSKPVQPSSGNGLFSDENDEDDDLFSKPSAFSKNKAKPTSATKSSALFDDDDDDLFGSKSAASKKTVEKNNSKDAAENNSQVSTSSRHSNQNVFDDPLMSLGNKK